MLVDVGLKSKDIYEQYFEDPLLESTREFYKNESNKFLSSNSCIDFLYKVEKRIEEETNRVENYLDSSTKNKLIDIVENEFLTNHLQKIVHVCII